MGARAWIAAALLALAAGCYETPRPVCAFRCGPAEACPEGYRCGGDGQCHLEVNGNLAACDPLPTPDAPMSVPDAPEETPDAPDQTPDAPDQTPDAPDQTPDAAEETPDAADDTPDAPDEAPDAAE
jgi:hypothetical protein